MTVVFDGTPPQRFYARPGLIATLLQHRGKPVLLAEFQGDQMGVSKKFVGVEHQRRGVAHRLRSVSGSTAASTCCIWEARPGEITQKERRLAGNVLLWLQDDVTYRLEGDSGQGTRCCELGAQITR